MRLLWNNLADLYTITASTEATGYPATNLQDTQLAKVWRSTTASTSILTIDFVTTQAFTCASIVGHNFNASVVAYFETAATSSFSAVSLVATIDFNADTMIRFFASQSNRYARYRIENSTATDGYLEAGRVFAGTYYDFVGYDPSVDFPYQLEDTSTRHDSWSGQIFGNPGVTLKIYEFALPFLTNTMRTDLETIYQTVYTVKPVILVPSTTLTTVAPLYCVFNKELAFNHLFSQNWNCQMAFKEAK